MMRPTTSAILFVVSPLLLGLDCSTAAFAPSIGFVGVARQTKPKSVFPSDRGGVAVTARCRRCIPRLQAKQTPDPSSSTSSGPLVNLNLVRQTLLNQAVIGITIWTGGDGLRVLREHAQFDAGALFLAAIGVLPLVFFSRRVEISESPAVADLNLSTNLLVLRLFGDRVQPFTALAVSALLASVTGLVEETTFRGQILPACTDYFDHNVVLGLASSTALFAVLHVNPLAFFGRGGFQAWADAAVLVAYQLVTGTWFALLYLFTGNLAVSIVGHALFDGYVFYGTHLTVTTQMAYARNQDIGSRSGVEAKWRQQRGNDFVLMARETFYLADTNRDGVLSREELRIALYSYGIRLSTEQSAAVAQAADVDQSGTIDFAEFLEFVGPSGSPSKAIKSSLLGVN